MRKGIYTEIRWQYPLRVDLLFYGDNRIFGTKLEELVAIPFSGVPSFLPRLLLKNTDRNVGWQFPSRVFLHFYRDYIKEIREINNVAIPFTGVPSFLHTRQIAVNHYQKNCGNTLHGCTFISTFILESIKMAMKSVAIPFTGVPSFLHHKPDSTMDDVIRWQYPSRVYLHFYGILSRTA